MASATFVLLRGDTNKSHSGLESAQRRHSVFFSHARNFLFNWDVSHNYVQRDHAEYLDRIKTFPVSINIFYKRRYSQTNFLVLY